MKHFLFYLFIVFSFTCFARSNEGKEELKTSNIKAYLNYFRTNESFIEYYNNSYYYTEDNVYTSVGDLSFAYEWSRKERFSNEIEWMPMSLNITENTSAYHRYTSNQLTMSGEKKTSFTSYLKYQYIYSVFKTEKRVQLICGIGGGLICNKLFNEPYTSRSSLVTNTILKLPFEINPEVEIKLKNNFFLTISNPIVINELTFGRKHDENPILSEMNRTTYSLYGKLFPKQLQTKVGLIYKLK